MPTMVATKTKQQTSPEPEPKVVTDAALGKIFADHKKVDKQNEGLFLKEVEYCKENNFWTGDKERDKISRKVIIATLVQYRALTEESAKAEASVLMRCCRPENEGLVQKCADGEITIRQLRKQSVFEPRAPKEESEEPDDEKVFTRKMKTLAKWGIEHNMFSDAKDFARFAREIFHGVLEKTQGEENGEEGDSESGEETDENDT
jgi:hypothetical protein